MFDAYFPAFPLFEVSRLWAATPEHFSCLVVDDEESVKSVIARILYQVDEGMDLSFVKNLDEATVSLKKNEYDLVIADYMLGDAGSGMDLWHYCQKNHPRLPVVLISSRSLTQIEEESRYHTIGLPYLRKPLQARECRELIESLI